MLDLPIYDNPKVINGRSSNLDADNGCNLKGNTNQTKLNLSL